MEPLNLIAIAAVVFGVLMIMGGSVHMISEGNVGVYYHSGALMPESTDPGLHFKWPVFTQVYEVQVTMQTDSVRNIPCGTSGGVVIHFDTIEVVNRLNKPAVLETVGNFSILYDKQLIYDRVHSEVNAFCSVHTLQEVYITKFAEMDDVIMRALQEGCKTWAPGLEIVAVRLTKPRIPADVANNFNGMEAARAAFQKAQEEHNVKVQQAKTKQEVEVTEARARREVSEINASMKIQEEEAQRKVQEIRDLAALASKKSEADALYYAQAKQAEGNALLLTPAYLELERNRAVVNNSKILYFGPDIPTSIWPLPKN